MMEITPLYDGLILFCPLRNLLLYNVVLGNALLAGDIL